MPSSTKIRRCQNVEQVEKFTKYHPLKLEVARMWNTDVTVVPIVIAAIHTISIVGEVIGGELLDRIIEYAECSFSRMYRDETFSLKFNRLNSRSGSHEK